MSLKLNSSRSLGVANVAYSAKSLAPPVEATALIVAACKKDKGWLFGHCRPRGSARVGHGEHRLILVYSVMRCVNSHRTDRNVYISSDLAFDFFRMAQDVASGQGFLEMRRSVTSWERDGAACGGIEGLLY
jgi:hypothetical protein